MIPMPDGTGDVLFGYLHRAKAIACRPLAILVHGLTGCADSIYMRVSARHLLDHGYPVLRLELRGAGSTAGLCREQYHAGRSGDIATVLAALDPALSCNGLVAIGFSLGGNMLLKLAGEMGRELPLERVVAVSPPVDLAAAARRIGTRRNALYQAYLLRGLKAEVLRSRGGLPRPLATAARRARSIVAFDDTVVAPRYGFTGAWDYYARSSALAVIDGIRRPTLVVHARDDPWIPDAAFEDRRWAHNPSLSLVLSRTGGHVGFHGRDSLTPWHDRQILRFLEDD